MKANARAVAWVMLSVVMAAGACERTTSVGAAGPGHDADSAGDASGGAGGAPVGSGGSGDTGGSSGAGGAGGATEAETTCRMTGGIIETALCCASVTEIPDTCLIGYCGCPPNSRAMITVCTCPTGQCFDLVQGCVTR